MARVVMRRRSVGSRGFLLLLLAAVAVFATLRLSAADRGQAFLVRHGLTRAFVPQLANRLDVTLARSFLGMGLVRGDIKMRDASEGGRRVREYSFISPAHLSPTLVHVRMRDAAAAVHGEVLAAEERHKPRDELIVILGFGRVPTHRVVVRPPVPQVVAEGGRKPRIALVIDDLGHNMNKTTRGILDLGVPFTVAVLPSLAKTDAVLEAARVRGIPALLHLPMEPEGGGNPGKQAIRVGMTPAEIDARIDHHVRRYKTFFGVNNHMGSRATADRPTMDAVAQALKRRGLIWVDSQTTPQSQGRAAARAAGVWAVANDLFLDDGQETESQVVANLERLGRIARKRGLAVGIGHPHPETLAALRSVLPRFQARGYEFVTLESLAPQPARVASRGKR